MLKHRLISAGILMPIVVSMLFLLSPVWFAVITLVVCMIAMWEWGWLSGFTLCHERALLVALFGLLLAMMLFLLPVYYANLYQLIVTGSLLISLGWWTLAFLLVIFYPKSAAIWQNSRVLRLIFGLLTMVPFFLEC